MNSFPKSDFLRLLVRLYMDQATGVILLQDRDRRISFFLKAGELVYAEGEKGGQDLVGKIASGKKLSHEEIAELTLLSKEQPRRLGKALIDRGLITPAWWRRFLEDKAKTAFTEALAMDSPDITFNQSELRILPINFIHQSAADLVFQRSPAPRNLLQIRDYLAGKKPRFRLTRDGLPLKGALPLTPSQSRLLCVLEGEKSWPGLLEETGMTFNGLARDLHVLLSVGFIEEAGPGVEASPGYGEYSDIVHLYMGLLGTVKAGLGEKQFRSLLEKCAIAGAGPVKTLFHTLPPIQEQAQALIQEILKRVGTMGGLADKRLLLLTTFNKLIYLMLSRIRKTAGPNRVRELIDQMTRILLQAEEGKRHPDLMLYLLGNLEDYAKQIAPK